MITAIRLSDDARWLDLVSPSAEDERQVEKELGIEIPTLDDIRRYEPSSRLYRENGAIFMAAQVVVKGDTALPQTTSVAFILKNDVLVTVRHEQSRTFDLMVTELQRNETDESSMMALIGLLEALVDRTSELLENAADASDDMAVSVFPAAEHPSKRRTAAELEALLSEIHRLHRRVAKVRESLVSLGRMTGYLLAQPDITESAFRSRAKSTSRDIISLTDHATFVSQNIQFVLDALLGLISVEQNAIVKAFSIVAVVLLPPTLIAAVYGMNFELMPELTWSWGYPATLVAMLASGALPYLWCRKRGWL